MVEIDCFEGWLEATQKAQSGELDGCEAFSRVAYKRLYFRRGKQPEAEYFTLARLGATFYISTRLKDAIVESGVTGLEIKECKRLFAG